MLTTIITIIIAVALILLNLFLVFDIGRITQRSKVLKEASKMLDVIYKAMEELPKTKKTDAKKYTKNDINVSYLQGRAEGVMDITRTVMSKNNKKK